jgi:metallophosphoesterase (TIGR00282 family)
MPSSRSVNVLFIGDIVGRRGRQAVSELLPGLRRDLAIDLVIANCENAAGGFGLTPKLGGELTAAGVDVMTSGNHIWDRREMVPELDSTNNVLRPLNYPSRVPGKGWNLFATADGTPVRVINLQGRVFMKAIDCPFQVAEGLLSEADRWITIVDMHAEATSEKIAMGWYLDGRVSAVIGTHTHVQTADERILTKGTAYITDVGMTGPFDSVIGIDKAIIIDRFLTGIPARFEAATGDVRLSAVAMSIDKDTYKALSIRRIQYPLGPVE